MNGKKSMEKLTKMNKLRKDAKKEALKPLTDGLLLEQLKASAPELYRHFISLWNLGSDFYHENEKYRIAYGIERFFRENERYIPDWFYKYDRVIKRYNDEFGTDLDEALIFLGYDKEEFFEDAGRDPDNLIQLFNSKCDSKEDELVNRIKDIESPNKVWLDRLSREYENPPEDFQDELRIRFKRVRDLGADQPPEIIDLLEIEDRLEDDFRAHEDLAILGKHRVIGNLSVIRNLGIEYNKLKEDLQKKDDEILARDSKLRDLDARIALKEAELKSLEGNKGIIEGEIQMRKDLLKNYSQTSLLPDGSSKTMESSKNMEDKGVTDDLEDDDDLDSGEDDLEDSEQEDTESSKTMEDIRVPSKKMEDKELKAPLSKLKAREGYIALEHGYVGIRASKYGRHVMLTELGKISGSMDDKEYERVLKRIKKDE